MAVVADYDPANHTHAATSAALEHAGLGFAWLATETVDRDDPAPALARFDAVVAGPASPYRSKDGMLAAIRHARERGVPFVGT